MDMYKRDTINSYNKNAKVFAEKFKGLFDLENRDEFRRFQELLSGKKVLDLGCGGGDHALYFQQQGLDVTCVDLSQEMVKLCKEKGLHAIVMDIEDLKFEKESFDGVWAVTSLLHVPKKNLGKVIDKIYYILRRDGIFYLCVKEGEGEKYVMDADEQRGFFAYWQDEELRKELKKFDLMDSKRNSVGNTSYLHFFLKKSK